MLLQCPRLCRLCSFPTSLKTVILRRASVAVITPPLIKTNGPSLGIAMLNGAISKAGHTCYSLDLNILQSFLDYTPFHSDPCSKNPIRGDHVRIPVGGMSSARSSKMHAQKPSQTSLIFTVVVKKLRNTCGLIGLV
jgi:hypothetical protein